MNAVAPVHKYVMLAFRRPRWSEYRRYLKDAIADGYTMISLERWLAEPRRGGRLLVMRHDVDLVAENARIMSDIERSLDVSSTYYFRWATFDVDVIRHLLANGNQVGLHYETLTRVAREHRLRRPDQITPAVVEACRNELKIEIAEFRRRTGSCDSVCAHGDRRARVIAANNADLLEGESYVDYGVRWSADDAAAITLFDCWVSDGEAVDTMWGNRISLPNAVAKGFKTILFNSHPNHWGEGHQVVTSRLRAHVGWYARRPTRRPEWGEPECLAWNRYRP